MRHILVTGGAGFIGSHLTQQLLQAGHRVTVVDNASTGSPRNLADVADHPQLELVVGDAGDPDLIDRLIVGIDHVYHLAAAVGVRTVIHDPLHTVVTNIMPTHAILQAASRENRRGHDVKVYLASTSEVYGKNASHEWGEDDDMVFGPTSRRRWSYGVTKAIDEFLALGYFQQRGLPVVVGRFFNVVGPRQTSAHGMVIPSMVEAALRGGPIVVHGNGQQTRCFLHVADAVAAMLELMDEPTAVGGVFNIGNNQSITIRGLAEMVVDIVNSASTIEMREYVDEFPADFEDVPHRVPRLDRLHRTIKARPRHTLETVIHDVAKALQAESMSGAATKPRQHSRNGAAVPRSAAASLKANSR
ncbi:MAG: GDP-mannose 4,6-dehydratase [Planctomycetales bacterium]|nr:GDP-mannose 4,6-dehydratase [Planctomycetales bacterium]